MAARLSALRACRTFTPRFLYFFLKDSWYSFLLEAESTPGPVRPVIGVTKALKFDVILKALNFAALRRLLP
jgi:hypothetical protein